MMVPMKENHLALLKYDDVSIDKLVILQKIVEIVDKMKIRIVMDLYD